MARRYIYGTNRECTKYQFLIESETDTEYNVTDVDMPGYDVTFKVDKKTLKFTANNPRWQFIVDELDFFATLDENEVKRKSNIYYLEYLENLLPKNIEHVNETQTKLDNFKQLEKVDVTLDDFNKLNIGDEIIVIDDEGRNIKAKCCGFYTIDKINFICNFDIDGKFISDVKQNYQGEFEIEHECYVYDDYYEYTYSVYLNQKHLDYHLNQQEYEKIVSLLNSAKQDLLKTEKQLAEWRVKVKMNKI